MKIMIGYPPIPSSKASAALPEPPVPVVQQAHLRLSHGARLCRFPRRPETATRSAGPTASPKAGPRAFEQEFQSFDPDLLLIEAKTPIINVLGNHEPPQISAAAPGSSSAAIIRPRSRQSPWLPVPRTSSSPAGNYDFLPGSRPSPRNRRAPAPGSGSATADRIGNTGRFVLDQDLNDLPVIDRDLTRWQLYAKENGNFRFTPGTYTMVGRDCWWGKCAFCSWTTLYNRWRCQTPERLADEIGLLIDRYGVKEVFDDSGCFPAGQWLRRFCELVVERGYHKKVVLGCNMIPGVLSQEHYDLMARANFRFLLFGLDPQVRNPGAHPQMQQANDIENSMRMAKKAGLQPHVTCMVAIPGKAKPRPARRLR